MDSLNTSAWISAIFQLSSKFARRRHSSKAKDDLNKLLDNGTDINAQAGSYGNALQAASAGGSQQIVELLLDAGANVNAQGGEYGNALQVASARGYKQIVELLLDTGADVNAQSGYYGNALQAASGRGYKQIVELLLDTGADVNAQSGQYGNALQAASAGGSEQIVKLLLDAGANVNAQGGYYGNALWAASCGGHVQIVELLLDNGADHSHTSLSNLGLTLSNQGKHEEAEAMHRRALNVRQKVLGPEHLDTLTSVRSVGFELEKQERYKEAEEMCRRARDITDKTLGSEHPATLACVSQLRRVLQKQYRYQGADVIRGQPLEEDKIVHSKVLAPASCDAPVEITHASSEVRLQALDHYLKPTATVDKSLGFIENASPPALSMVNSVSHPIIAENRLYKALKATAEVGSAESSNAQNNLAIGLGVTATSIAVANLGVTALNTHNGARSASAAERSAQVAEENLKLAKDNLKREERIDRHRKKQERSDDDESDDGSSSPSDAGSGKGRLSPRNSATTGQKTSSSKPLPTTPVRKQPANYGKKSSGEASKRVESLSVSGAYQSPRTLSKSRETCTGKILVPRRCVPTITQQTNTPYSGVSPSFNDCPSSSQLSPKGEAETAGSNSNHSPGLDSFGRSLTHIALSSQEQAKFRDSIKALEALHARTLEKTKKAKRPASHLEAACQNLVHKYDKTKKQTKKVQAPLVNGSTGEKEDRGRVKNTGSLTSHLNVNESILDFADNDIDNDGKESLREAPIPRLNEVKRTESTRTRGSEIPICPPNNDTSGMDHIGMPSTRSTVNVVGHALEVVRPTESVELRDFTLSNKNKDTDRRCRT
jgi:ankyrin repeat protein